MIDIIIVNWNAGFHVVQALVSIADHSDQLVRSVIVVDNASTDGSLKAIEAHAAVLNLPLKCIVNAENRGFAAACNQGAKLATSDTLLFLNPDVMLFRGSLRAPFAYLSAPDNADVGAVGIQLVDRHDRVSRSCARFPNFASFAMQSLALTHIPQLRRFGMHMSDWAHDTTQDVDHVIGAFLMIRKPLFDQLNGFDERFFVYLEDLDLSLRIKQAGQRIVYLTQARAFHLGGGTSHQVKAHRLFYALRSRMVYGAKHFVPWQARALVITICIAEPIARFARALFNLNLADARNCASAFRMLYRDAPTIWATLRGRS